ncbi:MAG: hypothetical protein OXI08_01280 [Cyanobacteria bacterium MAG IRC4_bin_6]|nr:hypothetical protein [Cyanobacteria bacterium MAG IRC4_bin_6]
MVATLQGIQALHIPFGSGISLFCEGQRHGGLSIEERPGSLDYTGALSLLN